MDPVKYICPFCKHPSEWPWGHVVLKLCNYHVQEDTSFKLGDKPGDYIKACSKCFLQFIEEDTRPAFIFGPSIFCTNVVCDCDFCIGA